jgi:hypothetical protein
MLLGDAPGLMGAARPGGHRSTRRCSRPRRTTCPRQRGMIAVMAAMGKHELVIPAVARRARRTPTTPDSPRPARRPGQHCPSCRRWDRSKAREIDAGFPALLAATEVLVRIERDTPEALAACSEPAAPAGRRHDRARHPGPAAGAWCASRAPRGWQARPGPARTLLRHALGSRPGLALGLPRAGAARAGREQPRHRAVATSTCSPSSTSTTATRAHAGTAPLPALGQPDQAARSCAARIPGACPSSRRDPGAEAYLHGHIKEALNQFFNAARSPLISADTYLTVARIAYAGGPGRHGAPALRPVLQKLAPTISAGRARSGCATSASPRPPRPPSRNPRPRPPRSRGPGDRRHGANRERDTRLRCPLSRSGQPAVRGSGTKRASPGIGISPIVRSGGARAAAAAGLHALDPVIVAQRAQAPGGGAAVPGRAPRGAGRRCQAAPRARPASARRRQARGSRRR